MTRAFMAVLSSRSRNHLLALLYYHRNLLVLQFPRSWCIYFSICSLCSLPLTPLRASPWRKSCSNTLRAFVKKRDAHGWHAPSQAALCSIAISSLSNKAVPLKFRASVIKQHPA
jgi:hypothetical protein